MYSAPNRNGITFINVNWKLFCKFADWPEVIVILTDIIIANCGIFWDRASFLRRVSAPSSESRISKWIRKLEVMRSCVTLVHILTARRYIAQDGSVHNRCENITSYICSNTILFLMRKHLFKIKSK